MEGRRQILQRSLRPGLVAFAWSHVQYIGASRKFLKVYGSDHTGLAWGFEGMWLTIVWAPS